MAGLATVRGGPPPSRPPLLSPFTPSSSSSPPFLSLSSSYDSSLFGYRLCFATFKFRSLSLSSSPFQFAVSARFGGKRSNDDHALDLSAVRSDKVRLIDEQQNMVGVMSKMDAIRRAEDAELDLVVLSPDADPPVVKIMNYDKYRYEQQKKKREQQKKSLANRMDTKELKMGYNIDVHDYSVRLKAAQKFLKDGDKVKVIVNLKGRGNVFLTKAIELIRRFQNDLGELATEEGNNFSKRTREEITERQIFMFLLPNKTTVQKSHEAPKKKASTAPARNEASPFSILREFL